jgi:RNA polymerase primary sigma factor
MSRVKHSEASPRKEKMPKKGSGPARENPPPMLSKEEKQEIWAEVVKLRKAMKRVPKESAKAEELAERYAYLRNKMIEAHLRFVEYVVNFQCQSFRSKSLDRDDLIQEGRIGLCKAFDHFDPSRGVGFLRYSERWIKGSICRAFIDKGSLVRIPLKAQLVLWKSNKIARRMMAEQKGEDEDTEAVARAADISPEKLKNIRSRAARRVVSLDSRDREGDKRSLAEKLPDAGLNPEEQFLCRDLEPIFAKALGYLGERQASVIRLRSGMGNGGEKRTYEEIGEELGIARQRVKQIEKRARAKLFQILCSRVFIGGRKELEAHLK